MAKDYILKPMYHEADVIRHFYSVSCWTDDAVLMPPGQATVTGKQALSAYVQASLQTPGFHITWKSRACRTFG